MFCCGLYQEWAIKHVKHVSIISTKFSALVTQLYKTQLLLFPQTQTINKQYFQNNLRLIAQMKNLESIKFILDENWRELDQQYISMKTNNNMKH